MFIIHLPPPLEHDEPAHLHAPTSLRARAMRRSREVRTPPKKSKFYRLVLNISGLDSLKLPSISAMSGHHLYPLHSIKTSLCTCILHQNPCARVMRGSRRGGGAEGADPPGISQITRYINDCFLALLLRIP